METAAFMRGATQAEARMGAMQRRFAQVGQSITSAGRGLTTALTVPLAAASVAMVRMAGNFEAAMGRVGISTQATAAQMGQMRELALRIGADTTRSASQAADAMDMLSKAGMSTTNILNGGARAAVALAEAAGSELDPAASAITDTMNQFHVTAAQLPQIVNNITGAVNESKLNFTDFQQAMGQAGGVAAASGVSFNDFTAAIAATASQFSSGSDAGTSLKSFLTRLEPSTRAAANAMRDLGLNFYDAQGKMLPMAQIAQQLREKLSRLSDQQRTQALTTIFGNDAMRTAVGLMQVGADGFASMQQRIQATDATAQAAQRMHGFNAELEKLKGAFETLAVRIADSGVLATLTSLVAKVGEWIDRLSQSSPEAFRFGVAIAGIGIAIGPVLIIIGNLMRVITPLKTALTEAGAAAIAFGAAVRTGGAAAAASGIIGFLSRVNPLLAAFAIAYVGFQAHNAAGGRMRATLPARLEAWDRDHPNAPAAIGRRRGLSYVINAVQPALNARAGRNAASTVPGVGGALPGFALAGTLVNSQMIASMLRATGQAKSAWQDMVQTITAPSLADQIRVQMEGLDAALVRPLKEATDAAADRFRDLQQLMNSLFPEQRRAIELARDMATIEGSDWPYAQRQAAISRRLQQEANDGPWTPIAANDIDEATDQAGAAMQDLAQIAERANRSIVISYADMARDVLGEVRGMVQGFKSGDIIGGLMGLLQVVTQVAGIIGGRTSSVARTINPEFLSNGQVYAGARALGGSVVPGQTYLVGERGREMFVPGVAGRIVPNHEAGASRVTIVPSKYFDVVVDSRAAAVAMPIAGAAAVGGSAHAQASLYAKARKQIP